MKTDFIFFGTPLVAKETLEVLLAAGYTPKLVITNPDAFIGRAHVLTPSPVKALATEKNIPVFTPEKLNDDALAYVQNQHADFALVVAYGKIFPQTLIDMFPKGVLNVHYSLLPKYRGATPLESALLHSEQTTGVTIQKMAFALDAGDIVATESMPIAETDTAKRLRSKLISMGATLLTTILPLYLADSVQIQKQNDADATFCHKLKKEDGFISLSASDRENWSKYRAYDDSIGTYFIENGKRIKITLAHFANGTFNIDRVIPEGRREISYAEFRKNNSN